MAKAKKTGKSTARATAKKAQANRGGRGGFRVAIPASKLYRAADLIDQGKTMAEAAKAVGISVSSVARRVTPAIRQLAKARRNPSFLTPPSPTAEHVSLHAENPLAGTALIDVLADAIAPIVLRRMLENISRVSKES